MSWPGAVVGLLEGGLLGFLFGMGLGKLINGVTRFHEGAYRRRIELMRTFDAVSGDRE